MESDTHLVLTNLVTHMRNEPRTLKNWLDTLLKRAFDFGGALVGLLLLWPFFLAIAWLIHRDSPGPIFYHGPRAGHKDRPFSIHKFRTMYEEPASYAGPKVTASGDGRITPMGQWLRSTKLNELPQLWNVLVGQMSLVGPRPEDVDIAADWPEEIRQELLSVRPGITSPATVIYRNEEQQLNPEAPMDNYLYDVLPPKLRLDLIYVRSRSVVTDIDVILWTAVALLPALRQSAIPQNKLIFGPIARLFSHYLRWIGLDCIVAFLAVASAGVIWRLEEPLNLGLGDAVLFAVIAALAFSLLNFMFGLHRVEWSRAPWQYVFPLAVSTALAIGLLQWINAWRFANFLPQSMLILSGLLAYLGFIAIRYRERLVTGLASRWITLRGGVPGLGERVLVVGAGDNFSLAAWLLNRSEWVNAYSIVGMVDDNPRRDGRVIEGYRVLGATVQIPELVKKLDIGLILYTMENILPEDQKRILELCRQTGVQLVLLPTSIEHFRMQMRNGCNPVDLEQDGAAFYPALTPSELDDIKNHINAKDWLAYEQRLEQMKKEMRGQHSNFPKG